MTPRHLVGPELLPTYGLVLKLALFGVTAAALTVGAAEALAGEPVRAFGAAATVAWTGLFVATGAVTLLFAALERSSPAARDRIQRRLSHLRRLPF